MGEKMPTGWMTADEARRWAKRGVWAFRSNIGSISVCAYTHGGQIDIDRQSVHTVAWRYIGPHPDDDAEPVAAAGSRWEVTALSWADAVPMLAAGWEPFTVYAIHGGSWVALRRLVTL